NLLFSATEGRGRLQFLEKRAFVHLRFDDVARDRAALSLWDLDFVLPGTAGQHVPTVGFAFEPRISRGAEDSHPNSPEAHVAIARVAHGEPEDAGTGGHRVDPAAFLELSRLEKDRDPHASPDPELGSSRAPGLLELGKLFEEDAIRLFQRPERGRRPHP